MYTAEEKKISMVLPSAGLCVLDLLDKVYNRDKTVYVGDQPVSLLNLKPTSLKGIHF